jgi:hypothetical protein
MSFGERGDISQLKAPGEREKELSHYTASSSQVNLLTCLRKKKDKKNGVLVLLPSWMVAKSESRPTFWISQ